MYPNELLNKYYQKIPFSVKVTFFSCFIVGILTHFYMLANKLPNYDDINCLSSYGAGGTSGRFMLALLGKGVGFLFGHFSMPWLYGIFAILFISLASGIVSYILNIKQFLSCFFVGAVMVSFPAITGIFFFMYTVPYYAFCILLTVVSVFIIFKFPKRIFSAAIVLAFSLGIYQAYIPLAAGIFVLILFYEGINTKDFKNILKQSAKYCTVLIMAILIYLALNKIIMFLYGAEMTAYQGLNKMGEISLLDFPRMITRSYEDFFRFLYQNSQGVNPYPIVRILTSMLCLLILFGSVMSYNLILKNINKKQKLWIVTILLACLVLFPLSVNAIHLMAPNSNVYSIMMYPLVLIYLFAVIILDHIQLINCKLFLTGIKKRICLLLNWCGTIALLIITMAQIYYSNVQYLAMQMQYEQAYSYFTSLVTEIKLTDGYNDELPLVIVGNTIHDGSFYNNDYFNDFLLTGRSHTLLNVFTRNQFLKIYLGFDQIIESNVEQWVGLPEIQKMPVYPKSGSIRVINDTIILKIE